MAEPVSQNPLSGLRTRRSTRSMWRRARSSRDRRAIVAVTVQGADEGDTSTIGKTLEEAEEQLDAVMEKAEEGQVHPDGLSEVVADKGYHSDRTLIELEDQGLRSYVSEPDRGRRKWDDNLDAQLAVYARRCRLWQLDTRDRRSCRHRCQSSGTETIRAPVRHPANTSLIRRISATCA